MGLKDEFAILGACFETGVGMGITFEVVRLLNLTHGSPVPDIVMQPAAVLVGAMVGSAICFNALTRNFQERTNLEEALPSASEQFAKASPLKGIPLVLTAAGAGLTALGTTVVGALGGAALIHLGAPRLHTPEPPLLYDDIPVITAPDPGFKPTLPPSNVTVKPVVRKTAVRKAAQNGPKK